MNKKNGLTTDFRQKPKINEYFENGYKVTEMYFPNSNTYMMTKEKGNYVFYYYRTSTYCTKGMYNKAEFDKRMRDFNWQMDEYNAQFEQKMSDWETKCNEWNKKVDEQLKSSFGSGYTSFSEFSEFPDFPDFPEFPSYSTPFYSMSQTSNFSDDFGGTSKDNTSSSGGSCLGCILWSIFILCIVCIILYGMGVLGANIIHFIVDFFKSLF